MDNIEKLLDAIDNPGKYSEKQIEELMEDPEVKEFYSLMSKTKASVAEEMPVDIDSEWALFNGRAKRRRQFFPSFFSGKVAAAVIIAVVSVVSVAAVIGIGAIALKDKHTPAVEEEEYVSVVSDTVADTCVGNPENGVEIADIVLFKDESLENIMAAIARYYNADVVFKDESKRSLRLYFKWDRSDTLHEISEALDGFEQISVSDKDGTLTIR